MQKFWKAVLLYAAQRLFKKPVFVEHYDFGRYWIQITEADDPHYIISLNQPLLASENGDMVKGTIERYKLVCAQRDKLLQVMEQVPPVLHATQRLMIASGHANGWTAGGPLNDEIDEAIAFAKKDSSSGASNKNVVSDRSTD